MEVELVSRGCVKPSSSTPNHLRTHKLSLLDQLAPIPPVYYIFVYPFSQLQEASPRADHETVDVVISQRTLLLKQSLSETLTRFYPLAGTIRDKVSVDCNDEGAYYVEARVNSPLADHLNQLEPGPLLQFLPLLGLSYDHDDVVPGSHVSMFQQTNFACGGMVICPAISHMVADGHAGLSFLKAWASIARAGGLGLDPPDHQHLYPDFDANVTILRSHYDRALPRELTLFNTFGHFMRTRLMTSRRFVLDAAAVSRLKAEVAAGQCLGGDPTRVEAVSALFWRRLMAVFKEIRSGIHRPSGIFHSVNLRRRAEQQLLSNNSPGNICLLATSICSGDDPDLGSLASQIREATSKVDAETVKEVITGDGAFQKLCEMMKETRNEFSYDMDLIMFSSWCNFGLYDVDFGWGKPLRAGHPGLGRRVQIALPFDCGVVLTDTRVGRGVEAVVILDEQAMALLEQDQELLSHAALDPILT